jgi:hypothetical protein
LNDLHSHSTFEFFYAKFSRIFVDTFCDNRRNNVGIEESIARARKEIKKYMFEVLNTGDDNPKIISFAYERACNDSRLVKRAIKYYRRIERMK